MAAQALTIPQAVPTHGETRQGHVNLVSQENGIKLGLNSPENHWVPAQPCPAQLCCAELLGEPRVHKCGKVREAVACLGQGFDVTQLAVSSSDQKGIN